MRRVDIDVQAVSDHLIECADQYILPRYNALKDNEISTKTGPQDLVTQADIDVENALKDILPGLLPHSVVLGEEGVSNGEMSLDMLHDKSKPIWVIDPVDGTFNFVHGKREFAVMVGLIVNGVTQYAWIYDVLGEAVTIAEVGAGAFCNGERLKVDNVTHIESMSGHINPKYFPKDYSDHIKEQRSKFRECRSIGCAGHEYLRIAKAEAQFSVYSRMKPWDHIAGSLIIREAGGEVYTWDGKIYETHHFNTGIIATTDKDEGWRRVIDIFTPL
ncbi:MAG: inositol monophosphatase [Bdellovibrionales bacterium]